MNVRAGSRLAALALAGVVTVWGMLPTAAFAEQDNPDFYGTIVGLSADRSSLTVSPSKDQWITVDVRELGAGPWDEGAFRVDNVILLRTRRVNNALVAMGWEQARDGSQRFEGVERRRPERERDREQPKVRQT